ncbi:hypothetical protein OESDEN_06086 [Oesophagostomum dentatum]|uniref:Hyaluronan-mediated motility receptor C-terminal domain-containing protein n=1 Tax=Oesophagostomum dentatum TaxID=61180 RepID=A0A0B1TCY9_OESDE|nr:hypothetical protein OESDEN_06086 [Oesophagostomum dentatum]
MDEREAQLIQLRAEKESLVRKYNELEAKQNQVLEELENKTKENQILHATKEQDDRALAELVGHNNQRQKVSYIEKMRLENYNLKRRIMELEKEVLNYQNVFDKARKDSKSGGPATRSRTRGSRENDY